MPVNSTHLDYDANIAAWLRAREVFAGQDTVKPTAVRCSPRLEPLSDPPQIHVRLPGVRVSWPAFPKPVNRFLEELWRVTARYGVLRRVTARSVCTTTHFAQNQCYCPGVPVNSTHLNYDANIAAQLRTRSSRPSGPCSSVSIRGFVPRSVLCLSRARTPVDWEGAGQSENRAYTALYPPERIINWRVYRVNGHCLRLPMDIPHSRPLLPTQ